MSIRILVADDHSVVRKGIRMLLEDEADMQIIGEASDGDETLEVLSRLEPDVLLLDITMPRMSGIEALRVISQQYPGLRTIMFGMHNNPDYILKALEYGAVGYLLKDTGQEDILQAIRSVVKGDLYYPPYAPSILIQHLISLNNPYKKTASPAGTSKTSIWNKITAREAQILTCLIDGLNSAEIAERFGISANTVANQRASIIRKAGVKTTVDLIRNALEEKIGRD